MQLIQCDNQNAWDQWLIEQPSAEFLQSWEWGEFQRSLERTVVRLRLVEGKAVLTQFQGIVHKLCPGFSYLYIPRLQGFSIGQDLFISFLRKFGVAWARLEPVTPLSFSSSHRIYEVASRQPQQTLRLDLKSSEKQLAKAMHPKTRYNIQLARRKDVTIRLEKNNQVFWQLVQETIQRDDFRGYIKDYYDALIARVVCNQWIAYKDNRPIGSILTVGFGDTMVYLHGASSNQERNCMASYLLQWQAIQQAKLDKFRWYDFWGIAPLTSKDSHQPTTCFNGFCWEVDHPWTGITRFKVGFGGIPFVYSKAVDVLVQPWKYALYKLVRRMFKTNSVQGGSTSG